MNLLKVETDNFSTNAKTAELLSVFLRVRLPTTQDKDLVHNGDVEADTERCQSDWITQPQTELQRI